MNVDGLNERVCREKHKEGERPATFMVWENNTEDTVYSCDFHLAAKVRHLWSILPNNPNVCVMVEPL